MYEFCSVGLLARDTLSPSMLGTCINKMEFLISTTCNQSSYINVIHI